MPDLPTNDAPLSSAPDGGGENAGGEDPSDASLPSALGDLREQIHRAVGEIERLRAEVRRLEAENDEHRRRVQELEADPAAGRDETALLVDDDPDALREQIDRFIKAIDVHIAEGGV